MKIGAGSETHILLLEDDPAHRDLVVREFLKDPDPFRISVAATVGDAREILERDPLPGKTTLIFAFR